MNTQLQATMRRRLENIRISIMETNEGKAYGEILGNNEGMSPMSHMSTIAAPHSISSYNPSAPEAHISQELIDFSNQHQLGSNVAQRMQEQGMTVQHLRLCTDEELRQISVDLGMDIYQRLRFIKGIADFSKRASDSSSMVGTTFGMNSSKVVFLGEMGMCLLCIYFVFVLFF